MLWLVQYENAYWTVCTLKKIYAVKLNYKWTVTYKLGQSLLKATVLYLAAAVIMIGERWKSGGIAC